jgi:tRNA U34 2-thiouridine synthase MnmA/TrmU
VVDTRGRQILTRYINTRRGEIVREPIDLTGYPSGVYLYTIEQPNGVKLTKKMMLLK